MAEKLADISVVRKVEPIAFRLKLGSLIRYLSLRSNAKNDQGCFNVKSKRYKQRLHPSARTGVGEPHRQEGTRC